MKMAELPIHHKPILLIHVSISFFHCFTDSCVSKDKDTQNAKPVRYVRVTSEYRLNQQHMIIKQCFILA